VKIINLSNKSFYILSKFQIQVNLKKKVKIISWIVTIIITLLMIITFIKRNELSNIVTNQIQSSSLVLLIVTIIIEIIPTYLSPELFVIQSQLIGLPLITILIYLIIGSIVGSAIAFELGRKYGMPLTLKLYNYEKVQKLEKKTDKYGKWIMLIAAISPVPYLPIVFGAFGIKRISFIFYGLIPRIITLIVIGLIFN